MKIDFPAPVKPARLSIPWYRLAQSLYKIGPALQSLLIRGSDTYALLTLSSPDFETLRIPGAFAAVQMNRVPELLPETLEMRKMPARKALMIPMGAVEEAGKKRINLQALFSQAAEAVRKSGLVFEETEGLFREYRPDGSHVERVELYLFVK